MRRHYPGPYGRTCGYWCRFLKAYVPRAVRAQQSGSNKPKLTYGELPNKLKANPGGNQQ